MRNIPEDNLAYPVLLSINTGSSGSGFLLNTGEKLFLITAKHVLFDKSNLRGEFVELICQTKEISDDSVAKLKLDLKLCNVLSHSTSDVSSIEIGIRSKKEGASDYTVTFLNGVEVVSAGKSSTVSVSAQTSTKLLKDVLISNDVFVYGYPTSLGLKNSPQFDFSKPLLRKGIVANTYSHHGTIILDCPVYFGNSGGPVVEVESINGAIHHKVIGVVSQFIPFVQQWHNPPTGIVNTEFLNSGYSVAVSMDKVFEMIGFKN